jgi:beta-glucosidase
MPAGTPGLPVQPMMIPLGVAATFSRRDAYASGAAIGLAERAAGGDLVDGPVADIARDPASAVTALTFGEDPLLAGQQVAAEVRGIQAQGALAMAAHYVADTGAGNVVLDDQTLHEIYLEPFADAVRARVAAIMCSGAAARVVGITPPGPESPGSAACANAGILTGVLRNELGFRGFVASGGQPDPGAISLASGLDMRLPTAGPDGMLRSSLSPAAIGAAIAKGSIQPSAIDEAAGRILVEMDRFGLLGQARGRHAPPEPAALARTAAQVALATAQDAATLLKNDGHALPLPAHERRSLALIGPAAGHAIAAIPAGSAIPAGAASTAGTASTAGAASTAPPVAPGAATAATGSSLNWQTGPVQALAYDLAGDPGSRLRYAAGDDMTGTPVPAWALSHDGQPGLIQTASGSSATQLVGNLDSTAAGGNALPAGSAHTWSGELSVPVTGAYWISLGLLGAGASISLDGKIIAQTGSGGSLVSADGVTGAGGSRLLPTTDGLDNLAVRQTLPAGSHTLTIAEVPDTSGGPVQIRLDWVTPAQQHSDLSAAVSAAKDAAATVVFAQSAGSLAGPLPDGQDQLIEDVAAVNPDTIVVLSTPGPLAMPWLGAVKSRPGNVVPGRGRGRYRERPARPGRPGRPASRHLARIGGPGRGRRAGNPPRADDGQAWPSGPEVPGSQRARGW